MCLIEYTVLVIWPGWGEVGTWQSNNPGIRVKSPRSLIFSFPVNFLFTSDQGPEWMISLSCMATSPCEIS